MNAQRGSEAWCVEVIDRFRSDSGNRPEAVAVLAADLADSGTVFPIDSGAADVASTGGPASLTTFLPPLILASWGTRVPKVGVPGRPAGVIDSFGSVPGYRTVLTPLEFRRALGQAGFASTDAAGAFTPADGKLFRARQRYGAQHNPALVVASLLAKKLAAGVQTAVFDVRVMRGGNFGEDLATAGPNMRLMEDTARVLGIDAVCVPSLGDAPAQPMLGRAEALSGLMALVQGDANPWLAAHFYECVNLARIAGQRDEPADRASIRDALDRHLRAQGVGGVSELLQHLGSVTRRFDVEPLRAPHGGRLLWQMDRLRATIVQHQGERTRQGIFPDECGVELLAPTGSIVMANAPIAMVRARGGVLGALLIELSTAVDIEPIERSKAQGV